MIITNFFRILFWESLQNLAPIVGFMYATKKWKKCQKRMAIGIIFLGMALGSLGIEVIEPLIYQEPVELQWNFSIPVNIGVFTSIAILALLYINTHEKVKWDIVASFVFGTIVTVSQAIAAPFSALAIFAHILSMSISAYVFILSTRWVVRHPDERIVLVRAFLINILGSVIIILIDYNHLIVGRV